LAGGGNVRWRLVDEAPLSTKKGIGEPHVSALKYMQGGLVGAEMGGKRLLVRLVRKKKVD